MIFEKKSFAKNNKFSNLTCTIYDELNLSLLGAAVALYSAMHTDKKLGGCIALSTMMPERRLPDPSTIINKGHLSINRKKIFLPVFFRHPLFPSTWRDRQHLANITWNSN